MPMRGACPVTSFSKGYSLTLIKVPRASQRRDKTLDAAPPACITVSGLSFGSVNGPQTNIPSLLDSTGLKGSTQQNPCSLSLIPKLLFSFLANSGGCKPTDNTTKSYWSVNLFPSSVT